MLVSHVHKLTKEWLVKKKKEKNRPIFIDDPAGGRAQNLLIRLAIGPQGQICKDRRTIYHILCINFCAREPCFEHLLSLIFFLNPD